MHTNKSLWKERRRRKQHLLIDESTSNEIRQTPHASSSMMKINKINAHAIVQLSALLAAALLGAALCAMRLQPADNNSNTLGLKLRGQISDPCPSLIANKTADGSIPNNEKKDINIGAASALPRIDSIVEIQVPTKMRESPVPAIVVLPSSYNIESDRRYSTFYLLHGAGTDYRSWSRRVNLTALADQYDTIIITPDGGITSWYIDSPIVDEYQYETFISRELVEFVDKEYRTRSDQKGRAIGGNSMGGHGALYLTIRHPNVFSTAISLSGGVDLRPFPEQWDIKKRLGLIADYPDRWEEHSVVTQASKGLDKNTELNLALDIGTGDFFLDVNRALHQKLLDMKVQHDYAERPGGHGWPYWQKTILYQMVFVDEHINR